MYTLDLAGKHALVLGVANHRSLAWAIAQQLHVAGASLCLTYAGERQKSGVEELAATIPGAIVLPCDVTDDAQIDAVARELNAGWGTIEMLVHGVAFANREDLEGSFLATSRAGFRLALEVSAFSLINVTNRVLPLLEKNGANIISLSYLAAERAVPAYNVMGSAKAVLEQSTRQMAYELGPKNIRVNAISAGPVNTLAARGIRGFGSLYKEHGERAALRRNITQEEVGKAALFLLTDMSSGMTGEVMYVDAGYRIMGV
jgi:enoyl-[acyl-carrier protein] reductase I